jgi:hypothetical protein
MIVVGDRFSPVVVQPQTCHRKNMGSNPPSHPSRLPSPPRNSAIGGNQRHHPLLRCSKKKSRKGNERSPSLHLKAIHTTFIYILFNKYLPKTYIKNPKTPLRASLAVTQLVETENGESSLPNFRVSLILVEMRNRNQKDELKKKSNVAKFFWR